MFSFRIPWKYQKTSGFLMFSGGIERSIDLKLVTWLLRKSSIDESITLENSKKFKVENSWMEMEIKK